MSGKLARITFGSIEDIPEVALAGTVEPTEAQLEILSFGEIVIEQNFLNKKRIKISNVKTKDNIPFAYKERTATRDEFVKRVDDYLLQRDAYLADIKEFQEGGRIFVHRIKGTLYSLIAAEQTQEPATA